MLKRHQQKVLSEHYANRISATSWLCDPGQVACSLCKRMDRIDAKDPPSKALPL